MKWMLRLTLAGLVSGFCTPALGAPGEALFAVVVGVNRSVDPELKTLRYADDDAARYFDLFRQLGARTVLLTRPDENTRRLHAQGAAEARLPRRAEFDHTMRDLKQQIALAKKRGLQTVLYFVYAGHGNMKDGSAYLTLEDGRLDGNELSSALVRRSQADRVHLIVDACYSVYLALGRGPGGDRRPAQGFSQLAKLTQLPNVGLLLATTPSRKSHEWEALQAGVFSHEVRSGLYGAADADNDGRVTYRELAAFVERANESIPNERYRPRVFARPPRSSKTLVELRHRSSTLAIASSQSGRYTLEDQHGVRLADFHSGKTQGLRLMLPPGKTLYLRRVGDATEYTIRSRSEPVQLAMLTPRKHSTLTRGAADHAFQRLFALPFDRGVVARYRFAKTSTLLVTKRPSTPSGTPWRRIFGWGSVSLGAAAVVGGVALSVSAQRLRDQSQTNVSHEEIVVRNGRIDTRNRWAVGLYSTAGAALLTGAALLLWPDGSATVGVGVSKQATLLSFEGHF